MVILGNRGGLELVGLPGRVGRALADFRRMTGLTAVTSVGSMTAPPPAILLPPVHPQCAGKLRTTRRRPPCDAEWRRHLRFAHTTRRSREHVCPLGLRCACVPIVLGDTVLGLAKCVAGAETSTNQFSSSVGVLELLIARSCRELEVSLLQEEARGLRESLELMSRVTRPERSADRRADVATEEDTRGQDPAPSPALMGRILEFLGEHYAEHDLSLARVARTMDRSEKYVAHLFVLSVGVRMRSYITSLRLRRACELLLQSNRTIEQIGRDSGFAHAARFRETFRRAVGVTPSQYRRVFAEP